jgi:hypothetical protein
MAKLASDSSLLRREFLRLAITLGGAAALASILEGCSEAGIDLETLPSPTGPEVPSLVPEFTPATTPVPEGLKTRQTRSFLPTENKGWQSDSFHQDE